MLLQVHATTLNYRDLVIANGGYPFPVKDNVVILSDGAGTIVEVGSDGQDISKGDYAISNFDISNIYGAQQDWLHGLGGPIDGMLRQYATLPATAIVKVPKTTTMSWGQLAALVCTGTTAWNSLYGNVPLKPGQTVLFQGTRGVSMTGLMLAKAAGAITIITSSSDDKLKLAKDKYTRRLQTGTRKLSRSRTVEAPTSSSRTAALAQSRRVLLALRMVASLLSWVS